MKGSVPVWKAIAIGLVWVNGPVLLLLIGPMSLVELSFRNGWITPSQKWLGLPAFLIGFVLAWLWWSFTVPKWRLWAYERVGDVPRLKRWAINVGLTWSDGNVFNRTEIKSKEHAAREQQLDPEHQEHQEKASTKSNDP